MIFENCRNEIQMANYKILTYIDSNYNLIKEERVKYSDYVILMSLSILRILIWFNKTYNLIPFPINEQTTINLNDRNHDYLIRKYCHWSEQIKDIRRPSMEIDLFVEKTISIKYFNGFKIIQKKILLGESLIYQRSFILNLLIWLHENVLIDLNKGINLRIKLATGFKFNNEWYKYLLDSYNYWSNNSKKLNRTPKEKIEIIGPSIVLDDSDDEISSPILRPATPTIRDIPSIPLP